MSRVVRLILVVVAMPIISGCSSSDHSAPQAVKPQPSVGPAHVAAAAAPVVAVAASPDAGLSTLSIPDSGPGDPDAALSALGTSTVIATLRRIGLAASSAAGVSSPSTMVAVAAADHQAAETILSGAIINDHRPVYVILMSGGPFTATLHPPGVAAPQGNFLRLSVDAATFRLTDFGYVNAEPALSQIGTGAVNLLSQ